MSYPKSRKKYLQGDENINHTAAWRIKKTIAKEEETPRQIPQSSTCCQRKIPTEIIPSLNEIEAPIDVENVTDLSRPHHKGSDDELFDTSNTTYTKDTKHLEDLLQSPGFLDTITTPVDKSPAELLLSVLKYSISNKLSITAMTNLMQLVNSIFATPVTPDSRYMIDKLFNSNDNADFHATCHRCEMYIGKFGTLNDNVECTNCHAIIDLSKPSSGNYFAIVDPSDAIAEYLHTYEDHYSYVMRERRHEKGHIKDVYDGKCYRDFVENLPQSDKQQYVTASFNTDGAPVFESSTYSIWPIYIMINELPVKHRFKNLIVCGLWFGKSKPQMNVFLDPFVDKINELSTSGIPCSIKGESLSVKLYALICCVDTIARSPMNGTMQFNAFYGCDWCFHPGEWFNGCVRYPVLETVCQHRDKENTIQLMKEAVEKGLPVLGVKQASPLINLFYFNIILGFVPDYLHCYLIGVVKQLTECLIRSISRNDLKIVEERQSKIKAPNQLGRLSRPLKDRAMWKAREWENWLLYYSIPVLESVVDKKLLQHWSLLGESLHILLKTDITCQELDKADQMLHEFVCGTERIYSKAAMTYNVHQLLHLASSVYNWGPLWAHSTFPFESGNHQLLTAIKCAKGVNLQILRNINIQRSVDILESKIYSNSYNTVKKFCRDSCKPQTMKFRKLSNITYFGSENIIDQELAVAFDLSLNTSTFSRIVKNGCLYASCEKENFRSCNSYAQSADRRYVKLVTFVVESVTDRQLAICNLIHTTPSEFSNSLQRIIHIDNQFIALETTDIRKICVFLQVSDTSYICSVPNLYKY